ncbi:MAG: 16S rRNA (guanine(966)-N(2))-methyltransferase RsmD [Proteobacteria bacterium]|nr:16S rRNA (guanine(966)-N(2))-methyltransferase RsmD [Pseudomonadota bacterium]
MRIVAGKHRGRTLKAPHGWPVRPTGDRVREAIFNLLQHGCGLDNLAGISVADVFAGTGALGFEALSRGAAQAVFIDTNPSAIATIRDNAGLLGEGERTAALRIDACHPGSPPAVVAAGFQLVFFDPPYDQNLLIPAMAALAEDGWLAASAIAVTETSQREAFVAPNQFSLIKERRYGSTRIMIYRWEPG